MHQLSYQTNINRFNIFGAIVPRIFDFSYTIIGHMERAID